jgi:hypothetical protein
MNNKISRDEIRAGTGWKMLNRSGPVGNRPVGITCPTREIPVKPVKNRRKIDEFFEKQFLEKMTSNMR